MDHLPSYSYIQLYIFSNNMYIYESIPYIKYVCCKYFFSYTMAYPCLKSTQNSVQSTLVYKHMPRF